MMTSSNTETLTAFATRALEGWEDHPFAELVHARIAAGSAEYADKSFDKSVEQLLREILEECADVVVWGGILDTVLRREWATALSDNRSNADPHAIAELRENLDVAAVIARNIATGLLNCYGKGLAPVEPADMSKLRLVRPEHMPPPVHE